MHIFASLFEKSKGNPVLYEGQTIYWEDIINLNKGTNINVNILSSNTKHNAALSIQIVAPQKEKGLEVNGKKENGFMFWDTTFPKEGVEIKVLNDDAKLKVSQRFAKVWLWPMHIEKTANKRIYYCFTDDYADFNGFIFEITNI